MRRCHIYNIVVLGLGLLVSASCNRELDPEVDGQPEIQLAAGSINTKGFLTTAGLAVDGTSFQTFDYLSGYNGTISGHSDGEEFQYFSSPLTYKSAAAEWKWVFGNPASPTTYRWTRTGTHHFFGWMLNDESAAGAQSTTFFETWTPGEKSLIAAKSLRAGSYQYDFLYSDMVPVSVADGVPSSVDLPMNHLFGALGITITNNSDLDITVNSVQLKNFPSKGSVRLDYDMSSTDVGLTYADPVSDGPYAYWANNIVTPFTLYNRNDPERAGKVYDCFYGTEIVSGEVPQFRLAWPVSFAALEPIVSGYDEDNNPVYSSDSPLIEVGYTQGGVTGTASFRFPRLLGAEAAITAGKKTLLNLSFADKQVLVSYRILPWEFKEFPMAFEGDAISTTQLKFVTNTYVSLPKETDAQGIKHDVIQLSASSTEGAYVAKGTFKAYTPVNARLIVTLGGNGEDFEVSLDSGETATGGNTSITIDPHRDGGLISLRIKPKGTPRSGSRCYLHFAVLDGARESDADTEINRDHYIIVIP